MPFEFAFLDWIQENLRCDWMDRLMILITKLGDTGMIWIVLCVILLIIPKTRKIGIVAMISFLLSVLFGNILLKNLVARPRPFQVDPSISLIIDAPSEYSFPSGHTSSSFSTAFAIFFCHKGYGIPALCLAALIAFTRLYLYVHFPTDILGGLLLGFLCGVAAWWIGKKVPLLNRLK